MSSTELDVVSGELIPVNHFAPDLKFAYSPQQAGEWMRSLQEYRKAVLTESTDYGIIPGTKQPTLYKPGAEKLLMVAGLGFTILKVEDDDSRTHQGVTYRCTVRRGAQIVAECDGYAGMDESRFYVSQADAEAKERANAEKWNKAPNATKFVEYRAPWNSVCKMAQKRAMVGATLNALAASGIFTQDLEDEIPSTPVVPPFNAMAMLKPHLDGLSKAALAELKTWRTAQELPAPSQMTADQAALTLVKIGALIATDTTDAPPEAATEPEPERDIELKENPDGTFSPAPKGPDQHRKITTKEAQQVHITAGSFKISDTDLDILIFGSTNGRSDSASDLTLAEQSALIYRMQCDPWKPADWLQACEKWADWKEKKTAVPA